MEMIGNIDDLTWVYTNSQLILETGDLQDT